MNYILIIILIAMFATIIFLSIKTHPIKIDIDRSREIFIEKPNSELEPYPTQPLELTQTNVVSGNQLDMLDRNDHLYSIMTYYPARYTEMYNYYDYFPHNLYDYYPFPAYNYETALNKPGVRRRRYHLPDKQVVDEEKDEIRNKINDIKILSSGYDIGFN